MVAEMILTNLMFYSAVIVFAIIWVKILTNYEEKNNGNKKNKKNKTRN